MITRIITPAIIAALSVTPTSLNAEVTVVNSLTVEAARTANGADTADTVSNWNLNGGNTVAVYFTAENANAFTATFGGESLTVVDAFDGDRHYAGIAYLINPTVSQGDVVINGTNSGGSRLSHAYSVISLSGVGSVAGSEFRTSNGDLSYTTSVDGGYVLGAAENNSYNGSTLPSVSGNPTVVMLQTNVDGNASMLHAHGAVTTAGSYNDNYTGSIEAAVTVAFETDGTPPPADSFALTITPATAPDTGYDLAWDSQTGKLYNLRTSPDLTGAIPTWTLVAGGIEATPPTNTYNVNSADPRRFYAVEEFDAPPPPPLLFKDFEEDNGDFTVSPSPTEGSAWEWGVPEGGTDAFLGWYIDDVTVTAD